ncbi:MAG: hypothetical protein ACYTG6_03585 [Planctomycetota bacterium]|jgi:hypothetical protein
MCARAVLLACVAALVSAGTSCGGGGGTTAGGPDQAFFPFTIGLRQIDFNLEGGAFVATDSGWGACDLEFEAPTGVLYFNLVIRIATTADWEVQNLPVHSRPVLPTDPPQRVTIPFSLGVISGTTVSSLEYAATLSTRPVQLAPSDFRTDLVTSWLQVWSTGEIGEAIVPQLLPAAFVFTFGIPTVETFSHHPTFFPNQEQGANESVPAAVSNSLQFLDVTNALGLSDTQTSIDTVKVLTGWTAGGAPSGPAGFAWWDGKSAAAALPPYALTTDVVAQDGTEAGRIVDFDRVIADLDLGRDVEVRIPGHAAAVVGALRLTVSGGTRYLLHVAHDVRQGFSDGTVVEPVLYDPRTNAYAGCWLFDGAQHDRFVVEYP